MARSENYLKKLSKEDVINLALNYLSMFDSTLRGKRNELSELKKRLWEAWIRLTVRKYVKGMLKKRAINMER